uniref:Alcohol oxidase n=1 Tax=Ganoderma boninense TaxID=34458 RepID=A0A5K1K7D6_9APHY|nr:Alcohol oxidase [Ganoderma boninense]
MTKTPDDFVFFWKPDGPNGWAGQWYPSPFTVRVTLPPSVPRRDGDGEEAKEEEERDVPGDLRAGRRPPLFLFLVRFIHNYDYTLRSGPRPDAEHALPAVEGHSTHDIEGSAPPPSPKEVKALGRKVKNFDDETWVRERTRIVLEGSLHKFRQNAPLRRELFATGERELAEASPLDRIWGIGMGEKKGWETCGGDAKGRQGWGLNLLGKALVEARAILREEFKDEVEGQVADGGDGEAL